LNKGSTQDIENRLTIHNQGLVNYSSKHLPWELLLFEKFETRSGAMKREKGYKTGVYAGNQKTYNRK
jgi:predicted GIY-YIG superfamily endonuclease